MLAAISEDEDHFAEEKTSEIVPYPDL